MFTLGKQVCMCPTRLNELLLTVVGRPVYCEMPHSSDTPPYVPDQFRPIKVSHKLKLTFCTIPQLKAIIINLMILSKDQQISLVCAASSRKWMMRCYLIDPLFPTN